MTMGRKRVLIMGNAPGGNYDAETIRLGLRLPPGRVYHVAIAHDEWCGIWSGRKCDCNPEIKVRPQTVEIAGETG